MKNVICTALLLGGAMAMNAQTADMFAPYKATDLRMPSVPIVVSDPYFSIWSPYDKLTDGNTTHWTSADKPLEGILRVDGVPYRFMGQKTTILENIVPMSDKEAWKGAISRTNPGKGWEMPDFNG